VKATKAPLQARIVADGVVRRWHERIETMEPDVLRILKVTLAAGIGFISQNAPENTAAHGQR
jgi:hypothetical protein